MVDGEDRLPQDHRGAGARWGRCGAACPVHGDLEPPAIKAESV